jgi:RNA polymerase sigma factor (sigma-70 family)
MKELSQMNDKELVDAYLAGNETAFTFLYQKTKVHLQSYTMSLFRNETLVEDFLQDIFVKIIPLLRNGQFCYGGFIQWLIPICKNRFIDILRKEKRIREKMKYLRLEELEKDPEWLLIDREKKDCLVRSVRKLKPELQQVIFLRYGNRSKFSTIAISQGASINTTLGRERYALKNLRKIAEVQDLRN